MENKTIIFLSLTIVILLGIITACVIYLYDGVDDEYAKMTGAIVKEEAVLAENEPDTQDVSVQEETGDDTPDAKAEKASPDKESAKAEKATSDKESAKAEKTSSDKESAKPAEPEPLQKWEAQVKNCATGKMNKLRWSPDGKLSMINEKGQTLWTVALADRPVGTAHEVDFYANKKIQFLFAAGGSLHLFDRLGREVSTYPRTLGALAKSDMKIVRNSSGEGYWKIETENGPRFFQTKDPTVHKALPE